RRPEQIPTRLERGFGTLRQPIDPQSVYPNKKVRVDENSTAAGSPGYRQRRALGRADAPAPVDPNDLTRQAAGVFVQQHGDHVGDLRGSADPVQRNGREKTSFAFRSGGAAFA